MWKVTRILLGYFLKYHPGKQKLPSLATAAILVAMMQGHFFFAFSKYLMVVLPVSLIGSPGIQYLGEKT